MICKTRGDNVLLYHEWRFLLLPISEVVFDGDECVRADLESAFDVTPNLDAPDALRKRILDKAWRDGVIFANQCSPEWALSIAQASRGKVSATALLRAFGGNT